MNLKIVGKMQMEINCSLMNSRKAHWYSERERESKYLYRNFGNNKVRCALLLLGLNILIISLSLSCFTHYFPGLFLSSTVNKSCASEILCLPFQRTRQTSDMNLSCPRQEPDTHCLSLCGILDICFPNIPVLFLLCHPQWAEYTSLCH